jgi:hypothetical protein
VAARGTASRARAHSIGCSRDSCSMHKGWRPRQAAELLAEADRNDSRVSRGPIRRASAREYLEGAVLRSVGFSPTCASVPQTCCAPHPLVTQCRLRRRRDREWARDACSVGIHPAVADLNVRAPQFETGEVLHRAKRLDRHRVLQLRRRWGERCRTGEAARRAAATRGAETLISLPDPDRQRAVAPVS